MGSIADIFLTMINGAQNLRISDYKKKLVTIVNHTIVNCTPVTYIIKKRKNIFKTSKRVTTNRAGGQKGENKPSLGRGNGRKRNEQLGSPLRGSLSFPLTHHRSPETPQKAAAAPAPDPPSTAQSGFLSY